MSATKDDGLRLFKEARALQQKAKSGDDLQKVPQKYEQALMIFKKVVEIKGEGEELPLYCIQL